MLLTLTVVGLLPKGSGRRAKAKNPANDHKSDKVKAVHPLDHGGRLKDGVASLKLSTSDGRTAFTIDGRQTKTMYCLVEMK